MRGLDKPALASAKSGRISINEKLKKFAESQKQNVLFYDLYTTIPFSPEMEDLWSDNLHFSVDGYAKIGTDLAKVIIDANILIK